MNSNLQNDFSLFDENSDILNALFDEITEEEVKELGIEINDEKFAITSDEQANFFLRRLEEIRSEKDKINNACNNEIERFVNKVNSFRAKETLSLDNTEKYFICLLESYARKQLEGSKKKSLKLPFGTMSFKKGQRKMVYEDEALMTYIKNNNLVDFIRTKEEINKAELKKAVELQEDGNVTLNGQVVEGITTLPAEETFSVK